MNRETSPAMRVTLWGVRGTFPAHGPQFRRFGQATCCIGIDTADAHLLLDGGTGLRAAGLALAARPALHPIHIMLSHTHADHVFGLNQFAPFWRADARIILWTPPYPGQRQAVRAMLQPPLFPVPMAEFPARVTFRQLPFDRVIEPSGRSVARVFPVRHPGGAVGFRIAAEGATLAYVTDHEHGDEEHDAEIARACAGADLLLYDATYTPDEMDARRGWGHSSWQAGLALRQAARARRTLLIHHAPDRTDAMLQAIQARVREQDEGGAIDVAREGQVIALKPRR